MNCETNIKLMSTYGVEKFLITGSSGFIGARLVINLIERGFQNIRCLVRESSNLERLNSVLGGRVKGRVEIVKGNLLAREDCMRIVKNVDVIYHLAAGTGTKSFSEAYLHSVVATRNLVEAALETKCLKRFVNVSSFAVYTNKGKPRWRLLDEDCPVEKHPESRALAYTYGKVKQDELVVDFGRQSRLPYVIVRPGCVYGPGNCSIPGRVGIEPFGFFMHLGGPNRIPFTYVDNCADAIILAGLAPGIEGEVFNIVDDNLPSSRTFLRCYKKYVKPFKSLYLPHFLSYLFCFFWECFSKWSRGQVPPAYTPREWVAIWKRTGYSNAKIKKLLGWEQRIQTTEGLRNLLRSCREILGIQGKNCLGD